MRKYVCINASGTEGGLSEGKEYEEKAVLPGSLFVQNNYGKLCWYHGYRFEEIEMKTPPEYTRPAHCKCTPAACGCPAPAPTKALTGTEMNIVKANIHALSEGLKAGRTTPHETRLVLETCLFILKGE